MFFRFFFIFPLQLEELKSKDRSIGLLKKEISALQGGGGGAKKERKAAKNSAQQSQEVSDILGQFPVLCVVT